MILIIIAWAVTASASASPNPHNYTLNFSQITDNVKEAQVFLFGQFISSLNHLNATEEVQKEDVNFLYQIWYNMNYTMEYYLMPLPPSIIDPESYEANMFPETDEQRTKFKNYMEEWKGQTDEDKSIVLQSITYQVGNQLVQNVPICQQVYNTNQTQMIQANNEKKKANSPEYISPVPWQHVEMPEAQYSLSRFVARAYQNEVSIQQELESMSTEEQWKIYETFCNFFGIPITESPPPPPSNPVPSGGEQPTDVTDQNPEPHEPHEPQEPSKHDEKVRIFLCTMGLLTTMIFLYYLALKIKSIIRMKQDEKSKIQSLQALVNI